MTIIVFMAIVVRPVASATALPVSGDAGGVTLIRKGGQ